MKFNVTEVEFDFCLDYAKLTFDEEDIEWCTLVREKVDSIIVSQVNYDMECG